MTRRRDRLATPLTHRRVRGASRDLHRVNDVYVIQGGEKHYGLTEPQAIVGSLDTAKLLVFKLYTDAGKVKAIDRRHWIAKRTQVDYVQITKVRVDP